MQPTAPSTTYTLLYCYATLHQLPTDLRPPNTGRLSQVGWQVHDTTQEAVSFSVGGAIHEDLRRLLLA